jgi:hypothetical protein
MGVKAYSFRLLARSGVCFTLIGSSAASGVVPAATRTLAAVRTALGGGVAFDALATA